MYKSVLNYKLFSIQITDKTQKQIISREFNTWFKKFTDSIDGQYDEYNKKRNNNIEFNCCFPKRKSDDWNVSNTVLYKNLSFNDIKEQNLVSAPCSIVPEQYAKEPETVKNLVSAPCSVVPEQYAKEPETVKNNDLYTENDINEKINDDVLFYHPQKIKEMVIKKNLLDGRSNLQSPLSLIEKSELVENKKATIKTKKKNKLTKEQKKILKKSNCKSYTLKVSKKITSIINNPNLYVISEV